MTVFQIRMRCRARVLPNLHHALGRGEAGARVRWSWSFPQSTVTMTMMQHAPKRHSTYHSLDRSSRVSLFYQTPTHICALYHPETPLKLQKPGNHTATATPKAVPVLSPCTMPSISRPLLAPPPLLPPRYGDSIFAFSVVGFVPSMPAASDTLTTLAAGALLGLRCSSASASAAAPVGVSGRR